jgi:hypothetical protein
MLSAAATTLSPVKSKSPMIKARYSRWMNAWEHRLTTRDTNRIVRPFDWGVEWTSGWPGMDSLPPDASPQEIQTAIIESNRRIVEHSDDFYSYQTPTDFRLEQRPIRVHGTGSHSNPEIDDRKYAGQTGTFLRFTSPVGTIHPENDTANARWFPAKGKRAMVVMPQWNSDAISHNAFARIFNPMGIAVLRLSMPFHDIRMPSEISRADYAVSANIGRTLTAARQGIIDIRCCLDWLEQQGYTELGVLGTSLGSCYAFIASAHDPRLKVNVFNHASTYFGDVVWSGDSTRHIRAAVEQVLDQDGLRQAFLGISPMMYFDKFERWPKKSLMIYTKYDQTFLPRYSEIIASEFRKRNTDTKIVCLPCGHYTLGETPFKYMDGWTIGRFVGKAFGPRDANVTVAASESLEA